VHEGPTCWRRRAPNGQALGSGTRLDASAEVLAHLRDVDRWLLDQG
jgi:hypothetical protein